MNRLRPALQLCLALAALGSIAVNNEARGQGPSRGDDAIVAFDAPTTGTKPPSRWQRMRAAVRNLRPGNRPADQGPTGRSDATVAQAQATSPRPAVPVPPTTGGPLPGSKRDPEVHRAQNATRLRSPSISADGPGPNSAGGLAVPSGPSDDPSFIPSALTMQTGGVPNPLPDALPAAPAPNPPSQPDAASSSNPPSQPDAGTNGNSGDQSSDQPSKSEKDSDKKDKDKKDKDKKSEDQTQLGLFHRLYKAYTDPKEEAEEEEASHRQGTIIPFASPPFPFADHVGPVVGYRDTTVWPLMEAIYKGPHGDWWKKSRIKMYGWVDPSANFSTSKHSNVPMSYDIVPNTLQLSQLIWIFERVTDSVQRDHTDWGFKWTSLVGIDYRYTTAKGYFSDQLLQRNNLYGYDPLQMYVDYYIPWVREGMILRLGRYISPIDIEAQLSPENYLYTHSIMYTYDPYTFTGLQSITKLNKNFTYIMGVQAGNDMAPWTAGAQPNGEFLLKWVSDSGNNSLFGGVDSVGKGYYSHGHDDLQVASLVWGHKFNDKFHTITEAYYLWERNARVGGTVTYGPAYPYFEGVGPGARLPGLSDAFGIVNYTAYKTSDKSFVVLRSDILNDPRGFRTGFGGTYFEHTLGFICHLTPWCTARPEIRLDYTSGQKSFDNGTAREQLSVNCDFIIRF
jgi:Putative beta-barrel porin-2, OmpL-like. bbp2